MEDQRRYDGEKKMEEITLHFGKGTAEPFTSKEDKEMIRIVIPNAERIRAGTLTRKQKRAALAAQYIRVKACKTAYIKVMRQLSTLTNTVIWSTLSMSGTKL